MTTEEQVAKEWDVTEMHPPRVRIYLKASVAEAERLPDGNWRVTGHGWLRKGVEFTEEDFRNNFEEL